jgi:hypothetical protein
MPTPEFTGNESQVIMWILQRGYQSEDELLNRWSLFNNRDYIYWRSVRAVKLKE